MFPIIGHQFQRESLAAAFKRGKLPTTLLFSGPRGIGKSLVAKELASVMFCEKHDGSVPGGCRQCKKCKLFISGNMPDFFFIKCDEKDTSNVAYIREILYSLNLKAFASGYRVVIFDRADQLSAQTCNVLLKSIEEPGKDVHFILITSNPSRLLDTVVSRCHHWRFNHLSDKELKEAIKQNPEILSDTELSQSDIEDLILLADGSLANIKELASRLSLWGDIKESLEKTFEGDIVQSYELASSLSKKKDDLPVPLQLMRIYARRRMLDASSSLARLKWAHALSNFISAENMIFERNLNPAYVLNAIFAQLMSDPILDSSYGLRDADHLISKMVI